RLQDAGQYVLAELRALEDEQTQLDGRAVTLERELRRLMDSGTGDTMGTPRGHGNRWGHGDHW
ncbi:EH1L1 protein, partial [Casuarius casuarius]|nr:EH1L1 protein [Casuarius casuarius]